MVNYETIIAPRRVCLGEVEHEVTVRHINGGWNVRVFVNGELNQEGRCYSRHHISATARDLLRWEDKSGNISKFASAARHRSTKI